MNKKNFLKHGRTTRLIRGNGKQVEASEDYGEDLMHRAWEVQNRSFVYNSTSALQFSLVHYTPIYTHIARNKA